VQDLVNLQQLLIMHFGGNWDKYLRCVLSSRVKGKKFVRHNPKTQSIINIILTAQFHLFYPECDAIFSYPGTLETISPFSYITNNAVSGVSRRKR